MTRGMKRFLALVFHELRLSGRDAASWMASWGFFAVAVLLIALGLGPDRDVLRNAASGTIWAVIILTVLLNADRFFAQDAEDGTLDRLLLGPLPVPLMVLAKLLAHIMVQGLSLIVMAPLAGLMLGLNGDAILWLLIALALGLPSITALAALGAALTLGARRGPVLMPLLILPLQLPVLIFASALSAPGGAPDTGSILPVLAGFMLVTLTSAPLAAAAALRLHAEE